MTELRAIPVPVEACPICGGIFCELWPSFAVSVRWCKSCGTLRVRTIDSEVIRVPEAAEVSDEQ